MCLHGGSGLGLGLGLSQGKCQGWGASADLAGVRHQELDVRPALVAWLETHLVTVQQ